MTPEPGPTPPDDSAPSALSETELSRQDIALVRRAVNQRWPMTPEKREVVIAALGRIVERGLDDVPIPGLDDGPRPSGDRDVIAAAKALIDADRLNMEQEKRDEAIPDRVVHEHHFASLSDEELVRRATSLASGDAPAGDQTAG